MYVAAHNGARIWGGAERATTRPVTVTTLSTFRASTSPNSPLEISTTHWVMP